MKFPANKKKKKTKQKKRKTNKFNRKGMGNKVSSRQVPAEGTYCCLGRTTSK
jgi:hypothetical protein